MQTRELIEECYRESLALLRRNLTPAGVLASSPSAKAAARNYDSIFGRDAAICALGMAASGEPDLARAALAGLVTLAGYQAHNGQIPKYVKPQLKEVDFWYSGCIDATLWWLIALRFLELRCPGLEFPEDFGDRARRALYWLECQEHQNWYLLQQGECSDWADIMPRSGFVLYSNALWYWTKRLYGIKSAAQTLHFANELLAPFDSSHPEQRRVRLFRHYVRNRCPATPFYLSFVNLSVWGQELDIFGNILAYLVGFSEPSCAGAAVDRLLALKAHEPYPVRVVGSPIEPGSPQWRRYMERHRLNFPWQYHNGGIWPFVGGFWILLLVRQGLEKLAWQELEKLARANQVGDWGFNEWFHGVTGAPLGMAGQSWNAALYILAYRALLNGERFIP